MDRTTDSVRGEFVGGGALGELIRSKADWAGSRLGHPSAWPQSLRTAVSIVLSSRFPMVIFWGEHFSVLYNDAYIPMMGSKHPALLGASGEEVWAEIWDVISPMLERARRGNATWSEDQLLAINREGFTEEAYFTFSYSPITDEARQVGGIFCAVRETTARVLSERRLAILRELGEQVAEAKTPNAASVASVATLVTDQKDIPFAALYLQEGDGFRRAAVSGVDEVVAPPSLGSDDAWGIGQATRAGVARRIERRDLQLPGGPWSEPSPGAFVVPIAKLGQDIPYGALVTGISPRLAFDDSYATFLKLASQHTASAIANAVAYEEERRRAESLAEIDRAKTLFFNNISHEFRTPLTLMLAPLEDMMSEQESDPAKRERLGLLHRNAQRLLRLVNTLLDFSRIEAGRINASFEPTDLATFTAELASSFRSACDRAGLTLDVQCPPLPEPIYVDHDMWEKIFLNLLSNAFKYTFEGSISVKVGLGGSSAELIVRDTGVGIADKDLPHLFERFHRIEGAKARSHEGSGIGLALVHELVRLHGGEVDVKSRVDQGTTFRVVIPLGSAHLSQDRVRSEPTRVSASHGVSGFVQEALSWVATSSSLPPPLSVVAENTSERQEHILLADDNADMREYLARLLRERWEVETVGDGQAALEAIVRSPPDLVLTDVMMPGLDGFALLRALRGDAALREIPVVLLSARAGEEATAEGLNAGADDYVVKPFTARDLLVRVAARLAAARAGRELRTALQRAEALSAELKASSDAMARVLRVSALFLAERSSVEAVLREIVDAAVAIAASDFGNIQILEPGTSDLRIVAHRGFPQWWLDYWNHLSLGQGTCGTALERGERVIVEDVEQSSVFSGAALDAQRRAGVRAVVSTPLLSRSGSPLGIFSMHYRVPHRPSDRMLQMLDLLARQAADIIERARGEEASSVIRRQLEQANRAKDEFLATMSHELRTPLNSMLGWATMLRRDASNPARVRKGLDVIERNAQAQSRLVGDLLDVSRIISGKLRLSLKRTAVSAIIYAAADVVRAAADAKGVRMVLDLDPDLGELVADADRLQQVVWNLLTNAVRFTPPKGRITITAHRSAAGIGIFVKDTGIGIAPEHLAHVFERFRQVDSSTTRAHGGLGLGLAIVRYLVDAHGGEVSVSSEGPDHGTTFSLRLPIRPVWIEEREEPEKGKAEPDAPSGPPSSALLMGVRVLVVEDDADSLELLKVVLEGAGASVTTSSGARQALAAPGAFDVVISDIGMPEMDGYAFLRSLRASTRGANVPAIALTAYARAEDADDAVRAGYQMHLAKPVDSARLVELVGSVLRER